MRRRRRIRKKGEKKEKEKEEEEEEEEVEEKNPDIFGCMDLSVPTVDHWCRQMSVTHWHDVRMRCGLPDCC